MSYRYTHITPKIRKLKKKKRFFKKPSFLISGCLVTLTIIAYGMLFWSKFQIAHIEVLGNQRIQQKDIEQVAWNNLNKKIFTAGMFTIASKSIFITNNNILIKTILNKFPDIGAVTIQKKFPQSMVVTVKERQPVALFCISGVSEKCFSMDENGVIFESPSTIPQDMVHITASIHDQEEALGTQIIDKNTLNTILKVRDNLKNNFNVGIKEVETGGVLIFKTDGQWQLFIDPASDVDLQIAKMNILLKDQISSDARKKLQYIYLQYKDRAFYK